MNTSEYRVWIRMWYRHSNAILPPPSGFRKNSCSINIYSTLLFSAFQYSFPLFLSFFFTLFRSLSHRHRERDTHTHTHTHTQTHTCSISLSLSHTYSLTHTHTHTHTHTQPHTHTNKHTTST